MFSSWLTTVIRGWLSDSRYSVVPSVDALFQITIVVVRSDVRRSTFSTHFCKGWGGLEVGTAIGTREEPPAACGERARRRGRARGRRPRRARRSGGGGRSGAADPGRAWAARFRPASRRRAARSL